MSSAKMAKHFTRAPRATAAAMGARTDAFWKLLEDAIHTGSNRVTADQFVQATQALGHPVQWTACKVTLNEMRKSPRVPGARLIIGASDVVIDHAQETVFEKREKERREMKYKLGSLLWKVLFDLDVADKALGKSDFVRKSWPSALSAKVTRLRSKSPVILIDAGTSTLAALDVLLSLRKIPFSVSVEGGPQGKCMNLIAPRIVTNSPPISELISNSREHRREIKVTLVGGDYRPDHKAMCGSITQAFLDRTLSLLGDLAIIGVTGYRHDPSDASPMFCCDDLDESNLKSTFLRLAWFRVLVFDSYKLRVPELHSPFAILSPAQVDLVIVDDGVQQGCSGEVAKLSSEATKAGVGVVLLSTKKRQTRT